MRRFSFSAAVLLLLSLAACGTPQERCEARVSAEYRNVIRLLAEVEANLARGYAWENQPVRSSGWRMCGGYYGGPAYYGYGYGYGSCYGGGPEVVRTRVAIDPEAEQRKRNSLQQRLNDLATRGPQSCQSLAGTARP